MKLQTVCNCDFYFVTLLCSQSYKRCNFKFWSYDFVTPFEVTAFVTSTTEKSPMTFTFEVTNVVTCEVTKHMNWALSYIMLSEE